jgi:hypothetical protein
MAVSQLICSLIRFGMGRENDSVTKREIEMAEVDFEIKCPSGYMAYVMYMDVFRVPSSIAGDIFSFCDSDADGYLELMDILRTLVPLLSGDEDLFVKCPSSMHEHIQPLFLCFTVYLF